MAAGVASLLCLTTAAGQALAARDSAEYVQGQVVVAFEAGSDRGARTNAVRERGGEVIDELMLPRTVLVALEAGTSVEEAVASYEADPDVAYAEPNFLYHTSALPNDPGFNQLWGLNQPSDRDIDAPEAWDVTTGSSSVVVAVVDTGIAYTHPDLAANIWANPGEIAGDGADNDGNGHVDDSRGWDFVGNDNDPGDPNGHGTHVAGTIGARGNNMIGVTGVNWQVRLMPVRAADAGGNLTSAAVANAFSYACGEGARVVNGSFGGPNQSMQIVTAMNSAACAGTLFVFAAGNGGGDGVGDNNDIAPQYPCGYSTTTTFPLTVDRVVCVAATAMSDAKATFSNFGLSSVDLGAPGFSILSTVPGSCRVRPRERHVDGLAARRRRRRARARPERVAERDRPSHGPARERRPGARPHRRNGRPAECARRGEPRPLAASASPSAAAPAAPAASASPSSAAASAGAARHRLDGARHEDHAGAGRLDGRAAGDVPLQVDRGLVDLPVPARRTPLGKLPPGEGVPEPATGAAHFPRARDRPGRQRGSHCGRAALAHPLVRETSVRRPNSSAFAATLGAMRVTRLFSFSRQSFRPRCSPASSRRTEASESR